MVRIPLHWPVALVVSKVARIPIERASRLVNIVAIALIVLCVLSALARAQAQNWNNAPTNWQNSEMNWENSPMNWKNSSLNFNNSQLNTSSNNGIYDADGRRAGYAVRNSNGVTNFFSNDGKRLGYIPAPDSEDDDEARED